MLKIKRLPLWNDGDAPAAEAEADAQVESSNAATTAAASTVDAPASTSGKRWGLFAVAAAFTVVGAFFFCRNVLPVNPLGVFYKRVEYASGDGKTVRRDSSPIDFHDYSFYFLDDPINQRVYYVDDRLIDDMSFFHTYHYLDAVKKLEMSDNFYENYEALKSSRVISLATSAVATLCGFALALFALLAPEKRRNVGAARGDAWH